MHTPLAELWELPDSLRPLVETELRDGEEIIWVGTPVPWRLAMRSIPTVLFGIPWTAFALFWMVGASGFQVPDFKEGFDLFPLFGVPFVLIGFGMLASPFFMAWKARRTAYVLTSDRAIILESGFAATIQSFAPDRLTELRRKQWRDGSGDLIFERRLDGYNDTDCNTIDYGFLAVAEVKMVEDLVRQLADPSTTIE